MIIADRMASPLPPRRVDMSDVICDQIDKSKFCKGLFSGHITNHAVK
jgi:hypothetical protein